MSSNGSGVMSDGQEAARIAAEASGKRQGGADDCSSVMALAVTSEAGSLVVGKLVAHADSKPAANTHPPIARKLATFDLPKRCTPFTTLQAPGARLV